LTSYLDRASGRLTRSGTERLPSHLEERYGIQVVRVAELDVGVYRIDRRDGPGWVARLFPRARPVAAAEEDGAVLRFLAGHDFPAERPAAAEAVSVLEGQGLLVTEQVSSVPRSERSQTIRDLGGLRRLGEMLGRLHTLPGGADAVGRDGGGWHHLTDGGPHDEITAARGLLADAEDLVPAGERPLYDSLRGELDALDDCAGLPAALVHPDFVLANVIASPDRGMVVVDWTGAGRGPRLWSLAFLLFAEGAKNLRRVDLVSAGYRRHVRPEPEELSRLAPAARARAVVLQTWGFCLGRTLLADAARGAAEARAIAEAVGIRAAAAFGDRP
jgi:Ser/Thr protein kinase RdoA (MazF antagonist)